VVVRFESLLRDVTLKGVIWESSQGSLGVVAATVPEELVVGELAEGWAVETLRE
jgi:hypothetical protein